MNEDTDPGLYRALNQLRKRAVRKADMDNPPFSADQKTSDFFTAMVKGIDSVKSAEDIHQLISSLKDKSFNNDTAREINNLIRMFDGLKGEDGKEYKEEKEYVKTEDEDDPDEESVSFHFVVDDSPTGIHNPADFKHYFFEGD